MSNGLKIVLTGATRGLGASMLEGFAAQGCVVHGCGSNADGVARLAKSYPSPIPSRPLMSPSPTR